MSKELMRLLPIACLVLLAGCHPGQNDVPWPVYGGSRGATHYSALRQIDTGNVTQLAPVWTYHTGDADDSLSQIQVNALVINGNLYGISARLKLFALDATNGQARWVFDPIARAGGIWVNFGLNSCRGVSFYDGGADDKRLFYGAGPFLWCIDALTGKPIANFGDSGRIDLHNDLGREVKDLFVASTTPGMVYKDLIIVSDRVAEEADAAPGHIRAYDVHTGRLRWIFHTIPWPGEEGYSSWDDTAAYKHLGGANAWAGFSLDEEKGILYAPIGSASYDFYGGRRLGNDLFANSVVALDAATGRRLWYFQTVHHDLWDRDLPTAPVLVTIKKDGQDIPAIAQATKSGFIFLFDRATGKLLSPVEERPVPFDSAMPGERPSPTQPFPTEMPAFARQSLTEADLNPLVPDSSLQDLKRRLAGYHTSRCYPPSRAGTVIFPGFDGGGEWGGPAYDPETGLLYVNANEMPWVLTMVDAKKAGAMVAEGRQGRGARPTVGEAAKALFITDCAVCHGADRKGGSNFPALTDLNKKYTSDQFIALVSAGRRMMPSFKHLGSDELRALGAFLLDDAAAQRTPFVDTSNKPRDPYFQMPYKATGYNKFLSKEGYPAVAPPWGTLTAIDLNRGAIAWKDTLGDYPEFKAKGIHTGTENYGGAVVTAGGLLIIAATSDAKIRAYNKRTGQLLWEGDLPAAGFATPSVYSAGGREYIVIACGGGKLHKHSGDAYVAFALP
jgi:quinoprotein glucose dehydrogenase